MQQTETYKLNLIETSDPFSPAALNENTQKIEEVMSGSLGGMDERIKVFEARRLAYGSYRGNSSQRNEIHLGFAPKFVFVARWGMYAYQGIMVDAEHPAETGNACGLTEDGFWVRAGRDDADININGATYCYIALL